MNEVKSKGYHWDGCIWSLDSTARNAIEKWPVWCLWLLVKMMLAVIKDECRFKSGGKNKLNQRDDCFNQR